MEETVYIVIDAEGKERKFNTHKEAIDFYYSDKPTVTARINKQMDEKRRLIFNEARNVRTYKDHLLPMVERNINDFNPNKTLTIDYQVYLGEKKGWSEGKYYHKSELSPSEWRGICKSYILMQRLARDSFIKEYKKARDELKKYKAELSSLKAKLKTLDDPNGERYFTKEEQEKYTESLNKIFKSTGQKLDW